MSKIIIIAEAGVNHNGKIEIAKQLIDVAADSGADYVKFQTFKALKLASKKAKKAAYQSNKSDNNSQFEMLKKLELSDEMHIELIDYCSKKNIGFLSSPFDPESIDYLNSLNLPIFKIPSGEIVNLPYLRKLGQINKPVLLSTGMADLGEIEDALNLLTSEGLSKNKITVIHCNSEYPTPYEDVNLKAMLTIKEAFDIEVGYSDHTPGIEIAIAAASLGAKVIEKHFTLDKKMEGPDHRASLEPNELKQMIKSIRIIESALGDGIKKPSKSELKNINVVRKSLHYAKSLKKNSRLKAEHLICLRPGDGISPMNLQDIIGKSLRKDIEEGEKVRITDLKE